MKVTYNFTPAPAAPLKAEPRPRRARADGGGSSGGMVGGYPFGSPFPYDAGNWSTPEMGDWNPQIRGPDAELNQFRDRIVARVRDHVRNDGLASGGIERILDNTVGARFRLRARPDYRLLADATGAKFDAVWADEFRRAAEARWRMFAEDLGRYNDVERQLTVAQQQRLALRHKLVDGDALVLNYFLPERVGRGAAQYATAFRVMDPDRLCNPFQQMDTHWLRGGIEIDDDGVRLAAHIREGEPGTWYSAIESMRWERVPFEDADGWIRVIHDFDRLRAGQHRGVSVFAPVLGRLKMLARYYGLELQQAALGAALGTYLTAPYDPEQVMDAVGGGDEAELSAYQQLRADYHKEKPALFNGINVPALAPGEDIKTVQSAHPSEGFDSFAHEMQAAGASALGLSLEQFNLRWNEMNYSSARAASLEVWKTLLRRRFEFAIGTCTPMFATWLHEPMERGELPLPAGAPDYVEFRTAYARCDWLGPARGWVDPVKEPQGAVLRMDAALSSLEDEAAEQGQDAEEILDRRANDIRMFRERGMEPPSWYRMNVPAQQAAQPEEEPQAQ